MLDLEGRISITIDPALTGQNRVSISSHRPVHACHTFQGKTPQQALTRIPLLFNICAIAQSRAALLATQRALGISSKLHPEIARDMLVLLETAREHLFRILVEWPGLFDLKVDAERLALLGQLVPDFKNTLFKSGDAFSLDSQLEADTVLLQQQIQALDKYLETQIFGIKPGAWLEIKSIDGLNRWMHNFDTIAAVSVRTICEEGWSSQGYADCTALPKLSTSELVERFESAQSRHFVEQPDWKGSIYETTPYSRQMGQPLMRLLVREFHNTLIARWISRLVELANIPQKLSIMKQQLAEIENQKLEVTEPAIGLAQVEAARGRLIHYLKMDQGRISSYQILAPTEWNFHPQGLVKNSLCHLSINHPQQLEKLARLLVNAIDPCVGYDLRIL